MKRTLRFIAVLALAAIVGVIAVPRAEAVIAFSRFLNLKVLHRLQLGTNDDKDNIATSAFATADWAFPVDGGCAETANIAITGAKTGDPCFVGLGPSDGGIAIPSAIGLGNLSCVVTATDVAILKLCGATAMGAIIDAGYQIRSFGVQ